MNTSMADAPSPVVAPPRRRRRWVSVLLVLVIFVAGMIAGGAGTIKVLQNRTLWRLRHPSEAAALDAAKLRGELKLNDDQTRQVERIIAQRQERLVRALSYEIRLLETQVAEILNEEQKRIWREKLDRFRQNWEAGSDSTGPATQEPPPRP